MAHPTPEREPAVGGAGRPFSELRDTGLLWLVNKAVFHPRGFALALFIDDDGEATGWKLEGDGSEPWRYEGSTPDGVPLDDAGFARVEAFLASLRPT